MRLRRLALGPRTAGDAARRGLISEDVYHELIRETDFSVEALSRIQGTMSADAREE